MNGIQIKPFEELTPDELYSIMKLRFDVFVREQQCFYNEYDAVDKKALHFFLEKEGEVIAYLRVYEVDGIIHMGRFVVQANYRHNKIGTQLIHHCLTFLQQEQHRSLLQISAQIYLKEYYTSFGFQTISDVYDDDGILHVDMELTLGSF